MQLKIRIEALEIFVTTTFLSTMDNCVCNNYLHWVIGL